MSLAANSPGLRKILYAATRKEWYRYLPLYFVVFLLVAPHPSVIIIITNHHVRTLHKPLFACLHVIIIYLLAFLTLSSLLVCVVRDPGSIKERDPAGDNPEVNDGYDVADEELSRLMTSNGDDGEDGDGMSLRQALASTDAEVEGRRQRWCKKCMAPKPERAHHCSTCGRCILKMDHHCPWLASKCIGHRTYPAFVHFVCCVTLQAIYIGTISARAVWYSFNHVLEVDNFTPIHELCLSLAGLVFSLVMGSFFVYHVYLILTNQTTLENISPFLLLRHLPPLPLPHDGERYMVSDPPKAHELSYKQRNLVKDAHSILRMYDVGLRKNVAQVFGSGGAPYRWLWRLWCGGSSPGDGRSFPRNPKTDEVLGRLATELAKAEMDRYR
ncbi:hypothetical protein AX15_007894 [Amanita polypyramis BW_CC]|nr:hypothetical protein AX15_007894 [Amanita polypyramis BW_CC]